MVLHLNRANNYMNKWQKVSGHTGAEDVLSTLIVVLDLGRRGTVPHPKSQQTSFTSRYVKNPNLQNNRNRDQCIKWYKQDTTYHKED